MKYRTSFAFFTALLLSLASCSANGGNNADTSGTPAQAAPESTTSAANTEAGTVTSGTSSPETAASDGSTSSSAAGKVSVLLDTSDMFTSRDADASYSDCTEITLSDGGITVSGSGASVSGNKVTITAKGSYLIKGTLSDGQIVVDADGEKVQIVLDSASVTSSGSAALYVKKADKVFVTTAKNSVNKLASAGEYVQTDDSNIDGAVFAKSDITFNGEGALEISSETAHGIVCKDDIKITGGSYTITAAKKGIDCNESVRAAGGDIVITSGTDGIHAENSKDASKGFVYIGGGNITITSGTDAVDASGEFALAGGTVKITSDGGVSNAPTHTGNGSWSPWDRDDRTSDGTTSESSKGIKSGSLITVTGGVLDIDSSDDALHSKGSVNISGGEICAKSGDDGIHAETDVQISGGTVDITQSYEGIEGQVIVISGGNVKVCASDDGMNAAGGSDSSSGGFMNTDSNAKIEISGGEVYVNADGDGLDSNGYLYVSGGKVFVSGPTNGGNGALDFGISSSITGGFVAAAGSSGMAENFGSDSTQGSILYNFDTTVSAGTEVILRDGSGNVLISFTPEKQYQSVVLSAPGVSAGNTYTVSAGGKDYTVEMTSNIYGSGSGFGGIGDFGGFGGFGDRPDRNGERPQMPDGEIPQFSGNGERPQMPDGEMPQFPDGSFGRGGAPGGTNPFAGQNDTQTA